MGACNSTEKEDTIVGVMVTTDLRAEVDKWNTRREDVLNNMDSLTELYLSMDTRNEQMRLIEENIEVFKEFFNLPPISSNILEQVEHMFQTGITRYIKSSK